MKGGMAGSPSDGILRIATNLQDVPAEIIADIYKHRWSIVLLRRFFKHILGCRHLLSTHPVGIQIQANRAIIACLLIHLWTGGKPTLRTFEMLCLYLQEWATLEEVMAHLEKLQAKSRQTDAAADRAAGMLPRRFPEEIAYQMRKTARGASRPIVPFDVRSGVSRARVGR